MNITGKGQEIQSKWNRLNNLYSTIRFEDNNSDETTIFTNWFFSKVQYFKRWNGVAWVRAKLKVYLSGVFVKKPLKRWNGTSWDNIDVSG